jgi:hypothetical protein
MEMCGIEGGWYVVAVDPVSDDNGEDEYDFQGLSTDDVLEEIYQYTYRSAIDFWGKCEYPESGLCFVNDYGFGQHVCAEGAHS